MSLRDDVRTTRYSAICRHCSLEVVVQNQDALDEVIDTLDGSSACRNAEGGHDMKQVFPQG